MVNKSKIKGSKWERDLAKALSAQAEISKRIPGSGAIGTTIGEPGLMGDLVVTYKFLPAPLKIEAKYGYGGSTQMTVKREWMEKIREQASYDNTIPAVSIKFRDVTGGDIESAKWICFSVEDWNRITEHLNELFEDLEEYWNWKYGTKEKRR